MSQSTVEHVTLPPDHPAHQNLNIFLKLLLTLGPLIAAPFIKSAGAKAVFAAEAPIVQALADSVPTAE